MAISGPRRYFLLCIIITFLTSASCFHYLERHRFIGMNLFGDIFDDGHLKGQKPPKNPLLSKLIRKEPASFVLQERLLSLSGEDFVVRDIAGGVVLKIDGANVKIGGVVIDKLGFKDNKGAKFMSVERRILATTTCYDIYNNNGEVVAKIDRELFALTPTYKFFYEGDSNPFPDYYAEGSFSDRQYTFKSGSGAVIGRAFRAVEAFRDVDKYQVEVLALP